MPALISFLLKALVISLSGVMAPGPVTVATVAAGTRIRHAGALVAVGHAVIEMPLMFLIMLGIGKLFALRGVKIGIGLAGGAFLLLMGVQMIVGLRRPGAASEAPRARHPLWTGVLLTAGNPYFLLWWATIGLALATEATQFGALAFGLFALVHWLCDLIWLEALSLASFSGSRLMGEKIQKVVLGICAAALIVFGFSFLYDAAGKALYGVGRG